METKQYLGQIKRLDRMIQNKLAEIYQLKTMACSITIEPKEDKIQTSSDKDKIGTTVAKIVDLENEVDNLVDELANLKSSVLNIIKQIDRESYREILCMKYFEGKSIYEIAGILNMTDRGCKKAHKRALEELEKHNI